MRRVQVHRVFGDAPAAVVVQRLAGIRVDIEPREVAAGETETDTVTFLKQQRRGIHFDGEFVRLARREHLGFAGTVAIAGAHDAVADVEIDAPGKVAVRRVDVDQLGREIGVGTVEQADQQMLDLDIVVRSKRRRSGCRFEGAAAHIVQTADQRLQLNWAHVITSPWDVTPAEPTH